MENRVGRCRMMVYCLQKERIECLEDGQRLKKLALIQGPGELSHEKIILLEFEKLAVFSIVFAHKQMCRLAGQYHRVFL